MTCSRCRKPHDRVPQHYCHACQATYMRSWRANLRASQAALRTARLAKLARKFNATPRETRNA